MPKRPLRVWSLENLSVLLWGSHFAGVSPASHADSHDIRISAFSRISISVNTREEVFFSSPDLASFFCRW